MARLARASSSADRSDAWRIAGLAAGFVLVSFPTWSLRLRGQPISFPWLTLAFAVIVFGVVGGWRRRELPSIAAFGPRRANAIVMALAVAGVLLVAAERWVDRILWNPLDPLHSDMLVVTREAVRRFLKGHNPYTLYHVPWEAPLPYGPLLWGPFVVAEALRFDVRAVSVAGELFVPVLCGVAAVLDAARGRLLAAAMWLVLLTAIVFNPDLEMFTPAAHTPAYWPLLPLFAVGVTTERWYAAAVILGLLVAGRSTMVSLGPVFLIAVWHRDRARAMKAAAILLATVTTLLLPFAIVDYHALWYGMVASYPRVMKEVVWTGSDRAAVHTIGITAMLLSHHLERWVEAVQAVAVGIACVAAWLGIRRGDRPLPWMGVALLVFSMTTWWPVSYIYFDVLLLFVSAAFAETLGAVRPRIQVAAWLTVLTAVVVTVTALLYAAAPRYPVVDLTAGADRRALYRGFLPIDIDGARRFARTSGLRASIVLPRNAVSSADIIVTARPAAVAGGSSQAVTATLNGSLLGTVLAGPGWQPLRFRAAGPAWRIGANELVLESTDTMSVTRVEAAPDGGDHRAR